MDDQELPSHPLCTALIAECLPQFESLRTRLRARFPMATFHVVHHEAKSGYPKFILYLECGFPRDIPGGSDGLSIAISVFYLDTTPRINASVDWGSCECSETADAPPFPDWSSLMPPDFCGACSSSEEWPVADSGTLARLEADLPRLMAAYEACVVEAFALIQ